MDYRSHSCCLMDSGDDNLIYSGWVDPCAAGDSGHRYYRQIYSR